MAGPAEPRADPAQGPELQAVLAGADGPRLRYDLLGVGAAVTERCNLACEDCYWRVQSAGGTGTRPNDLAPDDFKKILNRFGRCALHCSITGWDVKINNI